MHTYHQLKWLQEQQLWVDRELEKLEPSSTEAQKANQLSPTAAAMENIDFEGYIIFQVKLDSLAWDQKIPRAAVPNVKACWDARRCRLGKDTS
ncbi:hypothetical protein VP01_2917g1 [Puccinia sorghi]|uniref:Uncharacterized protein n=1 Tax=Puccinia sorghi TaxID=27349 RepID=A0A0L6V186_9BASI|nr:hypothetical protein VP01_2917g1 [Puccinia sorghi]